MEAKSAIVKRRAREYRRVWRENENDNLSGRLKMVEWRDNLNRDKCRQKQWSTKESVEKQKYECRFLLCPFNTKKIVLIYDFAGPD